MKEMIVFTCMLLLFSCDPMNDDLFFINKSDRQILVRPCFIDGDSIRETWSGIHLINSDTLLNIVIMDNWGAEFNVYQAKELSFLIHVMEIDTCNSSSDCYLNLSDSLYAKGDYVIQSYSLDDLKNIRWKVVYPANSTSRH